MNNTTQALRLTEGNAEFAAGNPSLLQLGSLVYASELNPASYTLEICFISDVLQVAGLPPDPYADTVLFSALLPIEIQADYLDDAALVLNACNQTLPQGAFVLDLQRRVLWRYHHKTRLCDLPLAVWKEALDTQRFFISHLAPVIDAVGQGYLPLDAALEALEKSLLRPREPLEAQWKDLQRRLRKHLSTDVLS